MRHWIDPARPRFANGRQHGLDIVTKKIEKRAERSALVSHELLEMVEMALQTRRVVRGAHPVGDPVLKSRKQAVGQPAQLLLRRQFVIVVSNTAIGGIERGLLTFRLDVRTLEVVPERDNRITRIADKDGDAADVMRREQRQIMLGRREMLTADASVQSKERGELVRLDLLFARADKNSARTAEGRRDRGLNKDIRRFGKTGNDQMRCRRQTVPKLEIVDAGESAAGLFFDPANLRRR